MNKIYFSKSSVSIPQNPKAFTKDFAEMVSERLTDLSPSYIVTDEMKAGYEQFGEMFNSVCKANQNGDDPIAIVTPASTGSAKSVSAKLYLAYLATQNLSGMLIVSEVRDAIDAAGKINDMLDQNVAGVYYSVSKKNPDNNLRVEVTDLPRILIISHAMFISRSATGKNVAKLKKFQGRQRDCIIVDERINLLKSSSFGTREVEELVSILKRSNSKEPNRMAKILEDFNEVVFASTTTGSFEYNPSLFQVLRKEVLALTEDIREGKYAFQEGMRKRRTNSMQEQIDMVSLLDRIAFVVNERFVHTNEGRSVTLTRGENLIKVFGSIAILDATSNINPQYAYQKLNLTDIKLLDRISVRRYNSVTMHVCNIGGIPQSKTGIYSEPKAEGYLDFVVDNYLAVIASILKPTDKLLVITYKDLVPIFKDKCPFKNVEFIHYGSSAARGSNKYSSFNKAMVIGWFRKPKHYYNNIVASITDWDSYKPTNGNKQGDATHLEQMLIVDDLVQFFNRVRCRVATTSDGNCAPTELYLFTGGRADMGEAITTTVSREMEGINIKSWSPTISTRLKKKRSKIAERAELLVEWLLTKDKEYDALSVADIMSHFNWSRNILNNIINPKRKEKDNYFTLACEEEGIVRYKEGKTTFFKLPSSDSFTPSINN
jgi:hypothetical protein